MAEDLRNMATDSAVASSQAAAQAALACLTV